MHIATAQGLLDSQPDSSLEEICTNIAKYYKWCMNDMSGRAPGGTCIRGANALKKDGSNWMGLGFEKHAGGCGASMRAACIGLYFYDNMEMLMQVSIESGRITHHNPLGYLGSFVAALFTAFAIQDKPPR
jgi:ADP-ribosylarginine hydrolase